MPSGGSGAGWLVWRGSCAAPFGEPGTPCSSTAAILAYARDEGPARLGESASAAEAAELLVCLVRADFDARSRDDVVVGDDAGSRSLPGNYMRVYQRFESIRKLAVDGWADGALVLTRSLVTAAVRSIWLVDPPDRAERDTDHLMLDEYEQNAKMFCAILADDPEDRRWFEEQLAEALECKREVERWLEEADLPKTKQVPNEREMAKSIGFGHVYDVVYRFASGAVHHFPDLHAWHSLVQSPRLGTTSGPILYARKTLEGLTVRSSGRSRSTPSFS